MSHSACAFCKPHLGLCTLGVDSVYALLWRDQTGGRQFHACRIPDTVLYFDRQQPQWYFTSAKDGKSLLRKNRWNVTAEHICTAFLKHSHASDVLAYYVSEDVDVSGKPVVVVEYFDRESLVRFVSERVATGKVGRPGILQRFVDPKGSSNHLIQASWSPSLCVIERKVNLNRLSDRYTHLYDRVVTFEGATHLAIDSPVTSPSLVGRIQSVCSDIARHIAMTAGEVWNVRKLECYFKFDDQDQLYLLWVSNLETTPVYASKPLGSDHHFSSSSQVAERPKLIIPKAAMDSIHPRRGVIGRPFESPREVETDAYGQVIDSSSRAGLCTCPYCNMMFPPADVTFDITYKMAIQSSQADIKNAGHQLSDAKVSHDGRSDDEELQTDRKVGPMSLVPPVLRRLQPALTLERFLRLRNQPAFLYKTFKACKTCGPKLLACASDLAVEEERILESTKPNSARVPHRRQISTAPSAGSRSARSLSSSKGTRTQHYHRPSTTAASAGFDLDDDNTRPPRADHLNSSRDYEDDFEDAALDLQVRDKTEGLHDDEDVVVEDGDDPDFVVRKSASAHSQPHRGESKPKSASVKRMSAPVKSEAEFNSMVSRLAAPRIVTPKWDERKEMLERQELEQQRRQKLHQEKLLAKLREEELLMAAFAKLSGTTPFNLASHTRPVGQNLHPLAPSSASSSRPRHSAHALSRSLKRDSTSAHSARSTVSIRRSLSASITGTSRYSSHDKSPSDAPGTQHESPAPESEELILDDGVRLPPRRFVHDQDILDQLSDDGERQVLLDAIHS